MRRLSEADIHTIYDTCREDNGFRLSATDVGAALDSPFSLYCKYHADPAKKDPPDPFRETLSARGIKHESNILEADYPDLVTVKRKTPEDGFGAALQYMAEGVTSLVGFSRFGCRRACTVTPTFWRGARGSPYSAHITTS